MTKEWILEKLHNAVNGTEEEFYTDEELDKFATFYLDKCNENTTEYVIAESFVDFMQDTGNECRRCSECGNLMQEGYLDGGGFAYYCSDECLHKHYTDEEWIKECEEDDQTCWTQWY